MGDWGDQRLREGYRFMSWPLGRLVGMGNKNRGRGTPGTQPLMF